MKESGWHLDQSTGLTLAGDRVSGMTSISSEARPVAAEQAMYPCTHTRQWVVSSGARAAADVGGARAARGAGRWRRSAR